jgi:hypothetical protein
VKNFGSFVAFLSSEFHRYLMEDERRAGDVPANALIIFEIPGETAFNQWHRETSLRNREPEQPVVQVHIGSLRRHAVIEDVQVAALSA